MPCLLEQIIEEPYREKLNKYEQLTFETKEATRIPFGENIPTVAIGSLGGDIKKVHQQINVIPHPAGAIGRNVSTINKHNYINYNDDDYFITFLTKFHFNSNLTVLTFPEIFGKQNVFKLKSKAKDDNLVFDQYFRKIDFS